MMEKQWYVLHTLSGHEYKVQNSMVSRVKQEDLGEYIGEVLIPTEKVSEVKQGKKKTVSRKFFPGYVMANLALYDEKKKLVEETWYFVQNTPSVIGFVGGDSPVPLRPDEVDRIVNQVEDKSSSRMPSAAICS